MKFCGRQRRRLKGSLFGAYSQVDTGMLLAYTHQGHMRHSGSILISNETRKDQLNKHTYIKLLTLFRMNLGKRNMHEIK